ncbi:MAG: FtsX-like permease family protein [Actinomycetota bacterium]
MIELFRVLGLRYLRANRFRALLGLVAVALGVALYVSSRTMITSARASMEQTVRSLAGSAEWQVSRGRSLGIEEALVERIRKVPGAIAAPVIQASVPLRSPKGGTLLLLGVDFTNDSLLRLYRIDGRTTADPAQFAMAALIPNSIVVARSFAARHGLATGSTVEVETKEGLRTLLVTGMLADEGPARVADGSFAVMELHAAQALFGRPGFVDRIDVAHVSRERLLAACPGCSVLPASRSGSMTEDALARIESLVAISVIGLLVGLFIIYNSVQISVVQRLKEIGALRALGATQRQVLGLFLLEWTALGLLGSVTGIALGWALAHALLQTAGRSLNAIVPLIDFRHVVLEPATVAAGLALGCGTAFVAAFLPARGATRIPPVELLRAHGYRSGHRYGVLCAAGAGMMAAGLGMTALIRFSTTAGLVSIALVFIGLALALPQLLLLAARAARPLLQRLFRLEGYLAADNLAKFPQRTALTAVTLGGALAMMIATATLVSGFQVATARARSETFPFDFAIMATDLSSGSIYSGRAVPYRLLDEVRSVPGVDLAYGIRTAFAEFRAQDVMIVGIELPGFLEMHRRRNTRGWARRLDQSGDAVRMAAGEGVYVAENFAALYGVRPGAVIELPTPSGPRRLRVLRAIPEYSWPRGAIIMDLQTLRRLWQDDALSYVDVSAAPGVAPERLRSAIAAKLAGEYSLFLYDQAQIARISDDVLRQTVAVADLQVVVAMGIGFLGIVNSLLISVLQRTREIGLVRAVGMTRSQVARTVIIEGVFIALLGGLIGIAGGLIGGWLPLRLFTLAATGYLYPLVVPWKSAALALAAALIIGFVASLIPARRAANLPVLDAIGYE